MSSQLYKVLTEIDSGRKAIANTIKRKGYPTSSEDSLISVASSLEEFLPQKQPVDGILSTDGTIYYDNPEDDPEVWTEYKQWPNIYDVYHNAGILTYNDVEYYPASAFLLRTDLTEILFDNKTSSPFANNKIYIDLGTSKSILVTSGGTVYPYGSNFTIQLTDADKVTGEDGKTYYYLIHYIASTYTTVRVGNFTVELKNASSTFSTAVPPSTSNETLYF